MLAWLVLVQCADIAYISAIRNDEYGTVLSMFILAEMLVLLEKFFRGK